MTKNKERICWLENQEYGVQTTPPSENKRSCTTWEENGQRKCLQRAHSANLELALFVFPWSCIHKYLVNAQKLICLHVPGIHHPSFISAALGGEGGGGLLCLRVSSRGRDGSTSIRLKFFIIRDSGRWDCSEENIYVGSIHFSHSVTFLARHIIYSGQCTWPAFESSLHPFLCRALAATGAQLYALKILSSFGIPADEMAAAKIEVDLRGIEKGKIAMVQWQGTFLFPDFCFLLSFIKTTQNSSGWVE